MNLKKIVLVVVILTILSFTMLSAQARGGVSGNIKFNNNPVAGISLIVEIYMINNTAPIYVNTITTNANGDFAIWLQGVAGPGVPLPVYPYTVFDRITVRGAMPVCSHGSYNIKSPFMQYEQNSVGYYQWNWVTSVNGALFCTPCNISILDPK